MRSVWLCLVALLLTTNAWAQNKETKAQVAARLHAELALRYYTSGQTAIAVDELNTALKNRSDYIPALTLMGQIYAQLHQNTQARDYFEQAIQASDRQKVSSTDIRNSYAWFLCGNGQGDAAMQQFSLIFRDPLYPSMDKALTNAGVCAARMGRTTEANAYLAATLERDAQNAVALIYQAHLWINEQRFAQARDNLSKIKTLEVDPPTALWLELRLNQAQRRDAKALEKTLLDSYATSDEASWAKSHNYSKF